jgi:membrane-bound metal-dependent hydrolase YbcI (DUF457 family)
MPSPLGHALGGIAAAWAIDLVPGCRAWRTASPTASFYDRAGGLVTVACASLAAVPDADLLFGIHRTGTHSLSAALVVTIVAAAVTGWVTAGRAPVRRVALMCGAAYASHLLLDWLAMDPFAPSGIQLLWPFSREWFISGWDLFPQTERYRVLSAAAFRVNLNAFAWETAILLPVVVLLWSVRVKALAGFAAKVSRGDHAA